MVDQDRRRSFALALLPVAAAFRGAYAQDGMNRRPLIRSAARRPAKSTSYTLGSPDGLQAEILTLGGTLRSLTLPVKGKRIPLVLSLPDLPAYLKDTSYLGQLVGRYGNRIGGAAFELDGKTLQAHRQQRPATPCTAATSASASTSGKCWARGGGKNTYVKLGHHSPAGINGFPGNLDVTAMISVFENTLTLAYEATTDAPTPINFTWHPYFNTVGRSAPRASTSSGCMMAASHYLPVNDARVPTGEIAPVAGTPFDFRKPKSVRVPPPSSHPQIALTARLRSLLGARQTGAPVAAELYSPASGVRMRGEDQSSRAAGVWRLSPEDRVSGLARHLSRAGEFSGRAQSRELPEQHPAARRDASILHELQFLGMTDMKALLLALTLMFVAHEAGAACTKKHSRDPTFVELAVPDDAPRPSSVEDFRFITDETTFDAARSPRSGRPTPSTSNAHQHYSCSCVACRMAPKSRSSTQDRVVIENVRHDGHADLQARQEVRSSRCAILIRREHARALVVYQENAVGLQTEVSTA